MILELAEDLRKHCLSFESAFNPLVADALNENYDGVLNMMAESILAGQHQRPYISTLFVLRCEYPVS